MNRRKRLVTLFLIVPLIIVSCSSQPKPTTEPTLMPELVATLIPTKAPDFQILMEKDFNDPGDLDFVNIRMDQSQHYSKEELVTDSVFRMGDGKAIGGMDLLQPFGPGNIVHVQMRTSDQACFPIGLEMNADQKNDGWLMMQMTGCSKSTIDAKVVRTLPDQAQLFGKIEVTGNAVVTPNHWIDFFFWYPPSGDRLYMVSRAGIGLTTAEVSLPQNWQPGMASLQISNWSDSETQYVDIGLIRLASGSFSDYLEVYLENLDQVAVDLDTFLVSEPQAFPQVAPDQEQGGSDDGNPMNVVSVWLQDPLIVYGEGPEALAESNGNEFGPGAVKKYDAEKNVFSFGDSDGTIWCGLNRLLDESEGSEQGGNQAILVKFQPIPPDNLSFTFLGPQEFSVDFSEGIQFKSLQGIEEFNGSLKIQEGEWYDILMAIDRDGNFRSVIWKHGENGNTASFSKALGEADAAYRNGSWKFIIGSTAPMTFNFGEYSILSFSNFQQ